MKVEYHPAVHNEVRQIRDYHNEQSPGLGAAFVDEFERQVLRVAAEPERWTVREHPPVSNETFPLRHLLPEGWSRPPQGHGRQASAASPRVWKRSRIGPTKPDAANPEVTLWLTIEDQWRRIADLGR